MADVSVTLAGLVARSQGITEEAIDPSKTASDKMMQLTFDQDATAKSEAIDTSKDKGLVFNGGKFNLSDHKEMLQGMEVLGQQVLDEAKKEGVDITRLAEFKNIDLHIEAGTKDVSAKDVGAVLLATSLISSSSPSPRDQSGINSTFDDKLDKSDMENLLDPKHAAA